MNIKLEKIEKKHPDEDVDFLKDLVASLLERVDELETANRHLVAALSAYVGKGEDDEDECDDCDCDTCEFRHECFGDEDGENVEAEDEKAFDWELRKAQVADAVESSVEKVRHVVDRATGKAVEFANSEQGQKLKKAAATAVHEGKHAVTDAWRKFNEAVADKPTEKSENPNDKSKD